MKMSYMCSNTTFCGKKTIFESNITDNKIYYKDAEMILLSMNAFVSENNKQSATALLVQKRNI